MQRNLVVICIENGVDAATQDGNGLLFGISNPELFGSGGQTESGLFTHLGWCIRAGKHFDQEFGRAVQIILAIRVVPSRYNRRCMRQTPWGPLPVNDAHVHFFSHAFYAGLARQKKTEGVETLGPVLGWEMPQADPVILAGQWAAELDRQGVRRACLIASAPGDEASVAAAVAAYTERFYGFFMLDPTQSDAPERVQAAASNPHLHCMCLFPAMHTFSLTDARLVPLLEMVSDSGLAVFVHCGAMSVGVRKKLGLPSQFNLRYSNPLDLHPVALHFPKIRFIIPHFGAGLLRETLMVADLCPNVYLDTSSSNRWMNYENLDLRTVYQRAINVIGVERLLFGTDSSFFPRGWHAAIFDAQVKALYELGLEKEQAEPILALNLQRLLSERARV